MGGCRERALRGLQAKRRVQLRKSQAKSPWVKGLWRVPSAPPGRALLTLRLHGPATAAASAPVTDRQPARPGQGGDLSSTGCPKRLSASRRLRSRPSRTRACPGPTRPAQPGTARRNCAETHSGSPLVSSRLPARLLSRPRNGAPLRRPPLHHELSPAAAHPGKCGPHGLAGRRCLAAEARSTWVGDQPFA